MNSVLSKSDFISCFKKLSAEEKKALVQAGLSYQEAFQKGDGETLSKRYNDLINSIKKMEIENNVKLIDSPDGNYVNALSSLSGIFRTWVDDMEKMNAPKKGKIDFNSVNEVDEWLVDNPNIIPVSLRVSTKSTLGLFANHSKAKSLVVEYMEYNKPTGYKYGMSEEETTSLFTSKDADKVKADWKLSHPGLEPVLMSVVSNSRGSSGSLAFGMGLDFIEHNKVFCIYRTKNNEK